MNDELERVPLPSEHDAATRAWEVIARAFAERDPRPRRPRRRLAPALALAVACALIGVAVSPAGSELVHSLREAVGLRNAAPALVELPSAGELLVASAEGPWIVQPGGSRRLLGDYQQAAWSPHGLFLAVTRGRDLLALTTHGAIKWTLAAPGTPRVPRWSPDGYRIAYLVRTSLRVVAGDGRGDRLLARGVAPVAPAWRPSRTHGHVLAFATVRDELELYDVDRDVRLAREHLAAAPLELLWSPDGERLAVVSAHQVAIYARDGAARGTIPLRGRPVAAAFVPRSQRLAVILAGARSDTVVFDLDRPRRPPQQIFDGAGRFEGLAWSPNGAWLLLAWGSADQWLFVHPAPHEQISAVSAISAQFDPGRRGAPFPTLGGWCCSP